jgi:hypothetical protein
MYVITSTNNTSRSTVSAVLTMVSHGVTPEMRWFHRLVYYEMIKQELNRRLIYECEKRIKGKSR